MIYKILWFLVWTVTDFICALPSKEQRFGSRPLPGYITLQLLFFFSKTIGIQHYVTDNLLVVKMKLRAIQKYPCIRNRKRMCNDLWTFDMLWVGEIQRTKRQLHPEYCNILPNILSATPGRLGGCLGVIIEEFKFMAQHDCKIKPVGEFSEENATTAKKKTTVALHRFSLKLKHKISEVEIAFFS